MFTQSILIAENISILKLFHSILALIKYVLQKRAVQLLATEKILVFDNIFSSAPIAEIIYDEIEYYEQRNKTAHSTTVVTTTPSITTTPLPATAAPQETTTKSSSNTQSKQSNGKYVGAVYQATTEGIDTQYQSQIEFLDEKLVNMTFNLYEGMEGATFYYLVEGINIVLFEDDSYFNEDPIDLVIGNGYNVLLFQNFNGKLQFSTQLDDRFASPLLYDTFKKIK